MVRPVMTDCRPTRGARTSLSQQEEGCLFGKRKAKLGQVAPPQPFVQQSTIPQDKGEELDIPAQEAFPQSRQHIDISNFVFLAYPSCVKRGVPEVCCACELQKKAFVLGWSLCHPEVT
eukprot:3737509-Rhodomonas_salina.2